jgi:hypothetical protein
MAFSQFGTYGISKLNYFTNNLLFEFGSEH